jgi:hypothetical protein
MDTHSEKLLDKMCNKEEPDAYLYADKLAKIGSPEIFDSLVKILQEGDMDNAYLATRAISQMENRQQALDTLLDVIHDRKNQGQNGGLVQFLESFDLSEKFVDLFRIYLFGNFKASWIAKHYLDSVEFDITPRVLKKAEKHLKHFINNNSPSSEEYKLKLAEAEEIVGEIKEILET